MKLQKDYEKMSWPELTAEGRRRGLDPRLTTLKGMEGAGEKDRQKMIEQLTLRDQNRNSNNAFILSIISIIISLLSILISLIPLFTSR